MQWKSDFSGEIVRTPWRLAAAALLLALFIVNVYRAATQSISHDEAVLYQWFLSGDFSQVFGAENGNHHPLHTLLAKITVSLFGLSELSLRIPSLLGGLLYFYALFRICALLFGEGLLFLLAVAFLSLNPFLLDYLCCARGYSVALGFFLFGVYQLLLYVSGGRESRRLHWAAVAVGLSVGANVIMVFPATALTAIFLGILFVDGRIAKPVPNAEPAKQSRKKKRKSRHAAPLPSHARGAWHALLHFAIPAFLVAGLIVIQPRRLVQLEVDYFGPPSLLSILESMVRPSFLHAPGRLGLAAWSPEAIVRIVTAFVAPAGLAVLAVVTIIVLMRWVRQRSFEALPLIDQFLLLAGGMLPVTLLMIVASRYVFRVPYPEMRTVLYWFPLLGLACLSFVKKLAGGTRTARMFAAVVAVFPALCVVQFVTQFNTRYYAEWAYSAATKAMMAVVLEQHQSKPDSKVRIGATWQLEPGINFYRVMYGLDWIPPLRRQSPDGDFDYYFLLFDDRALVDRRGLKVLLQDNLSGAVLAQSPSR